MAVAINIFKTVTANVTTVGTTIYTAPAGYTSVVLLAQVSNIGGSTITVEANHLRNGNQTSIIKGISLPTADSLSLVQGKMILETGDGFEISASANAAAQIVLSLLETANP